MSEQSLALRIKTEMNELLQQKRYDTGKEFGNFFFRFLNHAAVEGILQRFQFAPLIGQPGGSVWVQRLSASGSVMPIRLPIT